MNVNETYNKNYVMYEIHSLINKHKLIIRHFLFTFLNRKIIFITNILKTIK